MGVHAPLLDLGALLAGHVVLSTAHAGSIELPIVVIALGAIPLHFGQAVVYISPFCLPNCATWDKE